MKYCAHNSSMNVQKAERESYLNKGSSRITGSLCRCVSELLYGLDQLMRAADKIIDVVIDV